MLVYRVAHATKTLNVDGHDFPAGPYTYMSILDMPLPLADMSGQHSGDPRHPSPTADNSLGRHIAEDEVCGFDSEEALLNWFESWLHPLSDAGFAIHVYEVCEDFVRVGANGQALFPAGWCQRVDMRPLPTEDEQLSLF